MKEHDFNWIKGDDYSYLIRLKFPSNSNIDISDWKFVMIANSVSERESRCHNRCLVKSVKGSAILPRLRHTVLKTGSVSSYYELEDFNPQTASTPSEIFEISTEDNNIEISNGRDIILSIPRNLTEEAQWSLASYTLKLMTSASKQKTIMTGFIEFNSECESSKVVKLDFDEEIEIDIDIENNIKETEKVEDPANSEEDNKSKDSAVPRENTEKDQSSSSDMTWSSALW